MLTTCYKRRMSSDDAIEKFTRSVTEGDARAIARALRLVDDRREPYLEILKRLHAHTGRAYTIGITGTPGAGKSTLVGALVSAIRERGLKVAVVAIDPTSPFSGGAILGDRIRMQKHFLDEGVFIRSVATRGNLGGLSRSTADIARVLDAGGYDIILIETVGVGQDELEIAKTADTTVVVVAPGLGDDIQAIKAGILEIADVFCVNKADRDGADIAALDLEQMIGMGALTEAAKKAGGHGHSAAMAILRAKPSDEEGAFHPKVVKTIAREGKGVEELLERCEEHRAYLETSGLGAARRREKLERELELIFREALIDEAEAKLSEAIAEANARLHQASDPYTEARRLVDALFDMKE